MSNTPVFYAKGDTPEMIHAFQEAQKTFKYFWREMSWEYRRIVPALDLACVKVAFTQPLDGDDTLVEHMWISEVQFDGEIVSGTLINDPNDVTHVQNGDWVEVPLHQISDWLFASQGKTYGGFTIHAMRAAMPDRERNEHDEAWGLEFGDFNNIQIVSGQAEHPEHLVTHPMDINMQEKFEDFLKEYPAEVNSADEDGYTLLHKEAIAGNSASVATLIKFNTNIHATTPKGKTALDFARQLEWNEVVSLLEKP